jgi:hypothetical protein
MNVRLQLAGLVRKIKYVGEAGSPRSTTVAVLSTTPSEPR